MEQTAGLTLTFRGALKLSCAGLFLLHLSIDASATPGGELTVQAAGSHLSFTWRHNPLPEPLQTIHPEIRSPTYRLERTTNWTRWERIFETSRSRTIQSKTLTVWVLSSITSAHAFFRVCRRIDFSETDFSGANLSGLDLSDATFRHSNLSQCIMRQSGLQNVNFTAASAVSADFTEADLAQANFSYADLTGAMLTDEQRNAAIFFATRMPDGRIYTDDLDAQMIVFQSFPRELLPPIDAYLKFRRDLRAIRTAFPRVATIHNYQRYEPGVVEVHATTAQIERIQEKLGPAAVTPLSSSGAILRFETLYNPIALTYVLENQFNVLANPTVRLGDGNEVHYNDRDSTYVLKKGSVDCPSGCIWNHYWIFSVSSDGTPALLREHRTGPAP